MVRQRAVALAMALLAVAVLPSAWAADPNSTHYTVCTSDFPPMQVVFDACCCVCRGGGGMWCHGGSRLTPAADHYSAAIDGTACASPPLHLHAGLPAMQQHRPAPTTALTSSCSAGQLRSRAGPRVSRLLSAVTLFNYLTSPASTPYNWFSALFHPAPTAHAASNTSIQGSYNFVCLPFDQMILDLTQPNGTCSLATAGITISSEREAKGITFSYPTYRSSLGIMVYSQDTASTDGFFFFKPFTWQASIHGLELGWWGCVCAPCGVVGNLRTQQHLQLRCHRCQARQEPVAPQTRRLQVWLALVLTVLAIPLVTFFTEFLSIEVSVWVSV